ncbi:MAG: DUF362 domain-containing protein [Pirellulaceae bacterium]
MKAKKLTRRDFVKKSAGIALGTAAGSMMAGSSTSEVDSEPEVVSVIRIRNDRVDLAVEEAIDLLGGIETVAKNKGRIMLKPNLVTEDPKCTTNLEVVKTLATIMQQSGKEVLIGEGSAAAQDFNVKDEVAYRTRNPKILNDMQRHVFNKLGCADLAEAIKAPLINLHSGKMAEVMVPNGLVFDKIVLHQSLTDVDLLCSVPMMKTHNLATVTLGMKNLIGLYPGTMYYSVRSWLHEKAAVAESPGIAFETIDMVRANKLGLTVIDGSTAMEGEGPVAGTLVPMNIIVAGTNPLATDLVAADLMGISPQEVPTFVWAHRTGLGPGNVNDVEVRGEKPNDVRRCFKKPEVVSWESISDTFGAEEI